MKHFTSAKDVENVPIFVEKALRLKEKYAKNPSKIATLGQHKTLGLVFFNPSLRTRMSSEKAAYNLGMTCISLDADRSWQLEFEDGTQMNGDKPEHIKEAARVMSQYCDVLGVRSFASLTNKTLDYQDFVIEKFKQYATVPVISLEGAILHPLQSLADAMTIEEIRAKENIKHRPKVVLTWAPHPKALPQAVPNSFLEWLQHTDVDLVMTHPDGYALDPRYTGGVRFEADQRAALRDADFVYAKNWSSYEDYGKVLSQNLDWTIDEAKMLLTRNGKFMHCLPVRRNQIATDGVLDGKNSVVIQQANNRTFAAMTVLKTLLKT
ncbi:MAG: N-acetylornithine carbamoyltransferase [Bacteroidota bacterium]|jgi:N-succinyl-L-ornithine transcarbamylase